MNFEKIIQQHNQHLFVMDKIQYSHLEKIAHDYIRIPTTSVPSEQAFSKQDKEASFIHNSKDANFIGDTVVAGENFENTDEKPGTVKAKYNDMIVSI